MKTLIFTFIFALLSTFAWAQNITITIDNIPQKGNLMVGLCNSQESFLNGDFLVGQDFKVEAGNSPVTAYFNVPAGTYGIAVYLDTNGNYQFDYGEESYGFSNHYIPMSPPQYDLFKFQLTDSYQETISLRQ